VDSGTLGTITEAAIFGIVADYNDTDNTKITVVGVGRGTSRTVRQSVIKPMAISNITYSGATTVGTTLDKAKFSFVINYSNGTTDTINGATTVSPATIQAVGNNTITVTYTEAGVTVTGTVVIVGKEEVITPTSISGITYSGDTSVGATLDKSKFSFTVHYNNGTSANKTGATSISPTTVGAVGNNTVTVNYTESGTTVSGTITIVGTPAINNLASTAILNVVDNPDSWLDNKRFSTSAINDFEGGKITNRIPCKVGDTVYIKGLQLQVNMSGSNPRMRLYNGTTVSDRGNITANALLNSSNGSSVNGDVSKIVLTAIGNANVDAELNRTFDHIRFGGVLRDGYTNDSVVITVNEEI
jgi:hypothetical protein